MIECALYMHVSDVVVQNFGMKFLLRRGECKTREIPIYEKMGKIVISITKIVISVKNLKFIL